MAYDAETYDVRLALLAHVKQTLQSGWTQGGAYDSEGIICGYLSPDVKTACLGVALVRANSALKLVEKAEQGSVWTVGGEVERIVMALGVEPMTGFQIIGFNDRHCTTVEQVIALVESWEERVAQLVPSASL